MVGYMCGWGWVCRVCGKIWLCVGGRVWGLWRGVAMCGQGVEKVIVCVGCPTPWYTAPTTKSGGISSGKQQALRVLMVYTDRTPQRRTTPATPRSCRWQQGVGPGHPPPSHTVPCRAHATPGTQPESCTAQWGSPTGWSPQPGPISCHLPGLCWKAGRRSGLAPSYLAPHHFQQSSRSCM